MESREKDLTEHVASKAAPGIGKAIRRLIPYFVYFLGFLAMALMVVVIVREAQKFQEKESRIQSGKNLKQIGKAFKDYNDAHGHLPPAVVYDKEGRPLYSWRVLLLPFLGEEDLYSQFKLDEAWDSPNNKPLLSKMPLAYVHPAEGKPKVPYGTYYQVFVGGGAIFEAGPNRKPLTLKQIDDAQKGRGTSNTLLVIEAANPVPWTKPEDLPYAPDQPLPSLGGFYKDFKFIFLMADGSVHGRPGYPEEMLRDLIPWNPREQEKPSE
jgi:hypothetical protein